MILEKLNKLGDTVYNFSELDIDIDDNAFKPIEAIIYSMTPKERENPQLLNGSRRARIAAGSGTSIQEVNRLLKQMDDMRKMMKKFQSNPLKRR